MRVCLIMAVGGAALLCGCPINAALSPFTATGTYAGAWEMAAPDTSAVLSCTATIELEHGSSLPFPMNHEVHGTLTFNFTCPRALAALGNRGIPAILTLELSGGLLPNGQLLFVSGVCEEIECQGIFLSVLGEDTDKDGQMDRLSGEWAFGALLDTTVALLSGTLSASASP